METTQGLIERSGELTSIEVEIGSAATDGRVIAIEGPAGIGKTRLLAAARDAALERGFRVLSGRGGEREREFSWGVVRQLFDPVLASATADERERLWSGAAGPARTLFEAPEAIAAPGGDSSFAVQHALFWLVANLAAEQPVLVAVDDLHWCDAPSLAFLDYAARRLEGLPVALLATTRPNEPGADQPLIDSLITSPLTIRIEPRALSESGTAALLEGTLGESGEATLLQFCHQATGGNPLLLNELARGLRSVGAGALAGDPEELLALGSRAVGRTVEMRLGPAGAGPMRLAEAAAVLGDGAPMARAIELAGLGDEEADEGAVVLARIEVLSPGSSIQFVHPVVRSAVYDRIGPRERARLHERAAEILRAAGSPAEEVGSHLIEVDPRGDAELVRALREAAGRALSGGDPRSAARFLERALAEPPAPDERTAVIAELGAAFAFVDLDASVKYLTEALELTTDPAARAGIAEILALGLQFRERYGEGVEVARKVLAELGSGHETLRRRLQTALIETAANDVGWGEFAYEEALAVPVPEPGDHDGLAIFALAQFMRARNLEINAGEALAGARLASNDAALLRPGSSGVSHMLPGMTLMLTDHYAEALEFTARALRMAERSGSNFSYSTLRIWRSIIQFRAGSLDDAISEGEEGLRTSLALGNRPGPAWAAATLAEAYIEAGELDHAEDVLRRARPADGIPRTWHWSNFRLAQGWLALRRGDPEAALAEAREGRELFESPGGTLNPSLYSWRRLAIAALLALGRKDEAREHAERELELARSWQGGRALGYALRAIGMTTGEVSMLEEAAEVLSGSEARLERAYALAELGAARRRANQRVESREPLRLALDLAESCGANPLAEHARTELRAAGVRARRAALSGVESLTPSELRTAALAAEGRANREIAQELFVTLKTVEVHLSNVYRKLEIGGRRELDGALTSPARS